MQYEEVKSELQSIVELCESIPQSYRNKCFEILLAAFLSSPSRRPVAAGPSGFGVAAGTPGPPEGEKMPLPTQVRVFMSRNDIDEAVLEAVFLYAGGEVHFIREPSPSKVAEAQIQWALLLALKSGMLENTIVVDPEDVRSMCQEKDAYDAANFAANFKRKLTAKLFRGLLEPHGESRGLTDEGERELAKLLNTLAGAQH
ncbi:MAG TPA: hypothetical protein VMW58_01580 [Anaerolineae bacterium]|nr:hypothetical protein [Anaerolineae bacterium]